MEHILDINDISKSFASSYGRNKVFGSEYKNVIDGLSIQLGRGKITSLVGGNGAGKTTLFNLISGLLRPDQGDILLSPGPASIDCTQASPWQIASAGVGRLFQGSRIFGPLTVLDHLLIQARPDIVESPFYSLFYPRQSRKTNKDLLDQIYQEMNQYDEFLELWHDRSKPASSLSYARQRLLSMAGLMLGGYELLLLDEPSSGLSHESIDLMYQYLDVMRQRGKTVFLIEHNMKFIHQAADECHFMAGGKIRYSGTPGEVLGQAEVKQSYLL